MFNLRAGAYEMSSAAKRMAELAFMLLENRLELVSLELRQEKRELVRVAVRGLLAVQLSLLALVLVCASIFWFVPQDYRGAVLLGLTAAVVLLAGVAVSALRQAAMRMGRPLRRTIEEFKRDREAL